MTKLISTLKQTMISNKTRITKTIIGFVGIVLILLLSGAGYTSFGMSSKGKILLYAISFVYFASFFILRIRVSFFREALNKKRIPVPRPLSIAVISILFFCFVSFVFNSDKAANINTYIAFSLIVVLSFFILTVFEPKEILKIFKNTIFVITAISIFISLLTSIAQTFYSSSFFAGEKTIYGTHLFITNDSISGLTNSYHFKTRLMSLFWEPSVLGVMLILAFICEIFTRKDKLLFIRIFVYLLGIVLTKSTAAYILLPFVLLLFITEKANNINLKAIAIVVFCVSVCLAFYFEDQIVDFLTKILPEVFGKIDLKTASFVTRFKSFGNCFSVFIKNPIFGFGGVSARNEYFAVSGSLIDAETSTFGYVLSSFGVSGVLYILSIAVGIIFCKKIDSFSKIVLIFIVALLSNIQCQTEILIVNVFYFMPLALTLLPKKIDEKNKSMFADSYESTKTIKDFIFSKNDSGEVSRNVIGSLILKCIAIFLAFFTIPVYLRYYNDNSATYGIWVAITSILSVVTVFDFGMGNGLKNKLIKNISEKNDSLSKIYISTTYVLTAMIGLFIFAIFSILIFSLNDQVLLNVFFNGQNQDTVDLNTFRIGVMIILLAIGSQFFMKNINYVLQAHQKNAITGIFMVITNGCLMLFALIFANVIPIKFKIVSLASAYFFFLITPLLVASIILYSKKYRSIAPSIKCVDFKKSKAIINSSFKFFAVQIGNLFLWSLNEFIILFVFNYQSSFVTEYTEYYKLFSLLPIILGTVIQQPIWTAISKAEAESDKKAIKKYIIFLAISTLLCILFNIILSVSLPLVFDIWLGNAAPAVTPSKVVSFVAYSIIYSISLMLVIIMNAMTLFKTQIATAIMSIVVKIPVVILIIHVFSWNVGWEIVMYVNTACYLPIFLFGAIEIIKHLKIKGFIGSKINEKE